MTVELAGELAGAAEVAGELTGAAEVAGVVGVGHAALLSNLLDWAACVRVQCEKCH